MSQGTRQGIWWGNILCQHGGCTGFCWQGCAFPAWHKRKGKGMPPVFPGTVLERKSKIPSAQKFPQGDEDEVAPTDILREEEKWALGTTDILGDGLGGTTTHSQSSVAPGIQPALYILWVPFPTHTFFCLMQEISFSPLPIASCQSMSSFFPTACCTVLFLPTHPQSSFSSLWVTRPADT